MSLQPDDPVADGQAWAQRQQDGFPRWVADYGGGDPGRWNFSLESVDTLSYIILDYFPTDEALEHPDNAGFTETAAWYIGEILRRADPKKLRWSRCDRGFYEGHYVVEPKTKNKDGTDNPRGLLDLVNHSGDPMHLRQCVGYRVPPWDKPWPPYIHASETGRWTWDEAGQRWCSQKDQWLNSVAGLLGVLAAELPDTPLDYSTASLEAVEAYTVTNATARDHGMYEAVIAYVGECLLRTGGENWIWDEHPMHLTNGFPVVKRSVWTASPAHLMEYARTLRNGQTFARVHRAWIADTEDRRRRGHPNVEQREATPTLDYTLPLPAGPAEKWANAQRDRFPDWVARYGGGRQWDFSAESIDSLRDVLFEHCPAGTPVLDAPPGDDYVDGLLWYYGETVHRARPSYWQLSSKWADGITFRERLSITRLDRSPSGSLTAGPITVFPVQDLDSTVRDGAIYRWKDTSKTFPERLRHSYEYWKRAVIIERIKNAQNRREQTKRRSGRRRSDEETLTRWLAARTDEFPQWTQQFGSGQNWDFSLDSLDALETLIRRIASGPEELLEDKANADFVEGAAWYFGEVLRRTDPERARWCYDRQCNPEPFLEMPSGVDPAAHLAVVYANDDGGVPRNHRFAFLHYYAPTRLREVPAS